MFRFTRLLPRQTTTALTRVDIEQIAHQVNRSKSLRHLNHQRYIAMGADGVHPDKVDSFQAARLRYFNLLHRDQISQGKEQLRLGQQMKPG